MKKYIRIIGNQKKLKIIKELLDRSDYLKTIILDTIILDISANTHRNDMNIFAEMVDKIYNGLFKYPQFQFVIKHQLFAADNPVAKNNKITTHKFFRQAYDYVKNLEPLKTTSSVFDKESLDFLLNFDIPFVKLANNDDSKKLYGDIPRKIPVLISIDNTNLFPGNYNTQYLACISNYPAKTKDYERILENIYFAGISDHTIEHIMIKDYKWEYYELHYIDEYRDDNPDAFAGAVTYEKLSQLVKDYKSDYINAKI